MSNLCLGMRDKREKHLKRFVAFCKSTLTFYVNRFLKLARKFYYGVICEMPQKPKRTLNRKANDFIANFSESKNLKTPPPNPLPQGEGEKLESAGLCPNPHLLLQSKSKQNNADLREFKNFFADFFSKKVRGEKPTLKKETSPSPCGRGLGGGVSPENESKNPKDSRELNEIFRLCPQNDKNSHESMDSRDSKHSLDCHPNGKSRNDIMVDSCDLAFAESYTKKVIYHNSTMPNLAMIKRRLSLYYCNQIHFKVNLV